MLIKTDNVRENQRKNCSDSNHAACSFSAGIHVLKRSQNYWELLKGRPWKWLKDKKPNQIILSHSVHQRGLKGQQLTHLINNTKWKRKLQVSLTEKTVSRKLLEGSEHRKMLDKTQNAYSILQKHLLRMWHWEEGNPTHCWDPSAFALILTITLINFSSRRTQVFFLLGIFGKKRVLVIASQVDFRNCNSQDPAEGRKLLLIKTGHKARKIGNIIQLDHFLEEATSSKSHMMFSKGTQTQPEGFGYSSSLVLFQC